MDRSIEGSCAHLGAVKLNSVGWEHFRDHLDGRKENQSPVPSRRGDAKNSPVSLSSVVQKQGYAFVSQHHKMNLNISIVAAIVRARFKIHSTLLAIPDTNLCPATSKQSRWSRLREISRIESLSMSERFRIK